MTTIGARVRSLREHRDWSQEDLAGASELQRPHISLIENNERTPGADSLAKLARALQTSTDYLLGLTDNPAPTPVANHPSLRDPAFAELADAWPNLSPVIQESMLNVIRVFLQVKAEKRGE